MGKNVESVQFMVKTISKLLLTAQDMVILLGLVVFFFTTMSVQLIGGELHEGNKKLEGSEYLEAHWSVLNFNDIPHAFGVWVVMLLCEYVPSLADAVDRVSPIPGVWIVFPIFYVVGVSIVFELVKAFTIEVFITLFRERAQKNKGAKGEDAFERCVRGFRKALDQRGENLHYSEAGNEHQHQAIQEALEKLERHAAKRQYLGHSSPNVSLVEAMLAEESPKHGHGHGKHH